MSGSANSAGRRQNKERLSVSLGPLPSENEMETNDEIDEGYVRRKRARTDYDRGSDGDEVRRDALHSSGLPLLPDSFRRSPKGKTSVIERPSETPSKYQPGSIVRVNLSNFVTYTKAEFHCGPNLNMVIGPNGTGKSTLVCGICLGLGGTTSLLGRAKDVSEFVKHGARHATVEIELAADPSRHRHNPIVKLRITKEDSKCAFSLDGKSCTRKTVHELARSFSIQIDNLCQFLPQDRVVEFAALSPIELLAQTQRAAAPNYMTRWHEELKSLGREQKQKEKELQTVTEQLQAMEDRQRSQEGEVGRLRERSALQERVALLEKLRPYAEYRALTELHKSARSRRKEAAKELSRLKRDIESHVSASDDKQRYLDAYNSEIESRQRIFTRAQRNAEEVCKKIKTADEEKEQCVREAIAEKSGSRQAKTEIILRQKEILQIQRALQVPPESFDPSEYNEQIREMKERIRTLEDRREELNEQMRQLSIQIEQRREVIGYAEEQKQRLQSQAGRQLSKLDGASRDTARAWSWIQENRDRFESEVCGPPMVECVVSDPRHADAVEQAIGKSDLMAITITSQRDFQMLHHQLYTVMRLTDIYLRMSQQALSSFPAPTSNEQLRSLGLECWVKDLIEGPDTVLAMLCDNRMIERIAFSSGDMTDDQSNAVKRSPIASWIAAGQINQITRRREYGDAGISIRANAIRKARLLTDAPIDSQVERDVNLRIAEARADIETIKDQISEIKHEYVKLGDEMKQLDTAYTALNEEKKQKQSQQSLFAGLGTKLSNVQQKLQAAQDRIAQGRDRALAKTREADDHCREMCQFTIDYANALLSAHTLQTQLYQFQIMAIEARSDLEQLQAQHGRERALIQSKEEETAELRQTEADLMTRGQLLQNQLIGLIATLTEEETEWQQVVAAWAPDRLDTEIQSLEAQLEMLEGNSNSNTIRNYEQRAINIEQRRKQVQEIKNFTEQLIGKVTELRRRWEPELDGLIAQISNAFAENFQRIDCAGEVAVYKDEDDFEKWAIQIRVKFRESEQLSILDSHRQSGGERAVSTIYYLMAMQSLAQAPFRVVDEVNQGMDPRNERFVHGRMVEIACAEHTSQYFLITPKLLPGLCYRPGMKVHCIASGEHVPPDHKQLDFDMLANKAMTLRTAAH